MRKIVFLALVLGVSISLKAQYYEEDVKEATFPKFSAKVLPTGLMGHFPTYSISLEHSVLKSMAIEYRLGLVYDGNYLTNDYTYFFNKGGVKSSVMFQLPIKKGERIVNYFGVEPFFNSLNFDRRRTFEIGCGVNCSYFSEVTYGVSRQDLGVRVSYGTLFYLSEVVFLEFSAGVGAQVSKFSPDNRKPQDILVEYGDGQYAEDERRSSPAVDATIKIGFVILK
ncbi:hypothetical protein BXY85_3131 [Roseivirga pacifica]|uniref:Outer membrane protein beta-barrel domain-containing protein n=1 Tax=Roseivirga pacifica TaxID=1267423 RepID=A0A1I0QUZ1_9BACT|nr:hypothetical protein [Roseivirga pacifica]RKQ42520.1 hypothetical protein BXY85_3131 [Roseivirga pacifica]SEW31379.1 hypothetical protein SAMN05216290_2743 [Roseivirga pacifica]